MKPLTFEQWLALQLAAQPPVKFAPCPRCDGKGEFECADCDGTGDQTADDEDWDDDWPYCETCGGSGIETCPRCNGRGDMAWQTYLAQLRRDADALEQWNARSMTALTQEGTSHV